MADTVLDLSAKSVSDSSLALQQRRASEDHSSPSPRTPPHIPSSSDGNDSDSSLPSSAIKPIAGPIPSSLHRPESPGTRSDGQDRGDSSSPTSSIAGLNRPFKSYSVVDAMSVFPVPTSPLLAGHSSGLPTTMSVGLGLSSLCDSSSFPSFPITPLTSHLLQRKRRAESRSSSTSDSPTSNKKVKHVTDDSKDESYWERRRKNNEAAKRSRDNRRCKEEEIAMRAAFLEQENLKLRAQVAILKNETAKLHYMLYNRL